jgi:hypothetical protein
MTLSSINQSKGRTSQYSGKQKIPHCRNSSKIQSSNQKHRGKIDTPNTHIHDNLLSYLGTGI